MKERTVVEKAEDFVREATSENTFKIIYIQASWLGEAEPPLTTGEWKLRSDKSQESDKHWQKRERGRDEESLTTQYMVSTVAK